MRLLDWRLAFKKQRGLGVVVGKLFRLAAHRVLLALVFNAFGHGDKALRSAALKRAATGQ